MVVAAPSPLATTFVELRIGLIHGAQSGGQRGLQPDVTPLGHLQDRLPDRITVSPKSPSKPRQPGLFCVRSHGVGRRCFR